MPTIDPDLRIRSVALAVSDLPRSVDFYQRVLGLPLIGRDDHHAELGSDARRPALVLGQIHGATPISPISTGLYHVAWLHPSRAALAASVRRVVAERWHFDGAADHGVSEALYLSDPDGLGHELYADRPRERWRRPADGHGVEMYTLPLDLDDLLAEWPGIPEPIVAPGTFIGHIHLKVADVPRAAAFYSGALGFEEQAQMPSASFLAAGGYHHHVGMNSWQSAGAQPPLESAPGLRRVEFELAGARALDELERAVADAPSATGVRRDEHGDLSVRDPDGQLLAFTRHNGGDDEGPASRP
jgi:catechol 2,3-dioxygenase